MEQKETTNIISRHDFLKKIGIATAGWIFTNIITPTNAFGPATSSRDTKQQLYDTMGDQIKSDQLNSSIPCSSRTQLWEYLEQNNYIYSFDWQQRLNTTPLDAQHKQQLSTLLQPIIHDHSNQNIATYRLLHNLIARSMRKHSFAGIEDSARKQFIWQLEETLPHGSAPYTYRYVNPEIVRLLDDTNVQSLLKLTHVQHQSSHYAPKLYPNTPLQIEDTYQHNGITKYSYTYAKSLLNQHHIGLKSSGMGLNEVGNNRSSNRSSLVGINASSIDGIIALVEDIRQRRNYHQKEYITGGTELSVHKSGPEGHEGGRKLDLGESVLILITLLEHGITAVHHTNGPITIGNYEYTFNYHGPDWHLDILIKGLTTAQNTQKAAN